MVANRRKRGAEPLTFAMTFPFSTHNYQLRFWMAVGGVDPDEDVRMVVLPPPFMADSLASGQVDAFCVGAPWNSIAVDRGAGHILHFVSDILVRAAGTSSYPGKRNSCLGTWPRFLSWHPLILVFPVLPFLRELFRSTCRFFPAGGFPR